MPRISAYSVFSNLGVYGFLNWMPDGLYLEIQYYLKMHRRLNLKYPKTMNEKLQWLKINDRKSIYIDLVDKYKVRKHIENAIGKQYLIPLIGTWESPKDICFENLPDQFVLKCNHDSGGVIVCKDKSKLNVKHSINLLQRRLKRDYSWGNREWPYRGVHRLVLAEQFLIDNSKYESLTDYKFYCFHGVPHCVLACVDRTKRNANYIYYDKNWNRLNYNIQTDAEKNRIVPKPKNLDLMFELSEKIAKYVGSAFLRVDFFNVKGRIFFGEVTFYPHSGMDTTLISEIDYKFGSMICLPGI